MSSCGSGYCHGTDGASGGAPDLTVAVPSHSDTDLRDIITNGTGYMPAQGYTGTDLDDVMAYLRYTFP